MERFVNSVGSLGVLHFSELPFMPKRIYWLSETPAHQERGNHAHKLLEQYVICLAGSVEIDIHNGEFLTSSKLDEKSNGLHIHPGSWRVLRNFKPNTTVLVLASREYEPSDYIYDFDEFLTWSGNG